MEGVEIKQEGITETTETTETDTTTKKARKQAKPKRRSYIFPRKSLVSLVRETCEKYGKKIMWTPKAIDAIIASLEEHLQKKFAVCSGINKLCKRSTLQKDVFDFVQAHIENL
jgi:hypothetical protein